jgi:hypothetical protein
MKFLLLLFLIVVITIVLGFPMKEIESIELSKESVFPIDLSLYNTLTVQGYDENNAPPQLLVSIIGEEVLYVSADEPIPHHVFTSEDGHELVFFSYFIRKEDTNKNLGKLALVSIQQSEDEYSFSRLVVASEEPLICKMLRRVF